MYILLGTTYLCGVTILVHSGIVYEISSYQKRQCLLTMNGQGEGRGGKQNRTEQQKKRNHLFVFGSNISLNLERPFS
jgi:hypothetical protein